MNNFKIISSKIVDLIFVKKTRQTFAFILLLLTTTTLLITTSSEIRFLREVHGLVIAAMITVTVPISLRSCTLCFPKWLLPSLGSLIRRVFLIRIRSTFIASKAKGALDDFTSLLRALALEFSHIN